MLAVAGIVLVVLGVAGLVAPGVIDIDPSAVGVLTGGSWVAIAVGVLLVLGAVARDLGPGVYLLATGVGALAAQPVTKWMDADWAQSARLWLGIGILLAIVVGAFLVVLESALDAAGTSVVALLAAGSLVTDIAVDFGPGWDQMVNVCTALFVAGVVLSLVFSMADDSSEGAGLLILSGMGAALAAVLITAMASFDLPVGASIPLALLVALGFYAIVLSVVYLAVDTAGEADMDELFEDAGLRKPTIAAAALGYIPVAVLVVVIGLPVPGWLVWVLLAVGTIAGVQAVRSGTTAYRGIRKPVPARLAQALGGLTELDPVYRLLPVSYAETPRTRPAPRN